MFDKLIVSEPEGAEFKNRRKYFMVSSLIVGVFFATAVVFSLYAADIGLGSDELVLSTIVAPPDLPAVKPETEQPRPATNAPASDSPVPSRQINMSSVDDPTIVPTTTSTAPVKALARPKGYYEIRGYDSNPSTYVGPARGTHGGPSGPVGPGLATESARAEVKDPEPPPAVKAPPMVKRVVSEGVVNGKATYLPVPAYPAPAKAVGAAGKVDVQVTIDEYGKVISANAVSGNPLLRGAAESAAWKAKFSPTYLSKVPVKVTGVIVYNFTR